MRSPHGLVGAAKVLPMRRILMALLLGLSRVGRSLTMCWDTPVGSSHGCCQVVRWLWFFAHPLPIFRSPAPLGSMLMGLVCPVETAQ